jgi:general secretion pathway protein C
MKTLELSGRAISLPLNAIAKWLFRLLLIVLAYQAASFTWRIVGLFSPQSPVQSSAMQKGSAQRVTQQAKSIPDIAQLHLFGDARVTTAASTPTVAPKTRLNLTLHGVYVDPDSRKSGAIIGAAGGRQKFFKQGQKIDLAPGVSLAEVRANEVILSRNGRFESLRFVKKTLNLPSVHNVTSSTRKLTGINKQNIMENVRVVPVFAGASGFKGYRLLPRKNRAIYNRLGIRPTDIVLSINGISLKNQREAMRVINELYKARQVELQIERNGNLQTLTVDLSG